MDRYKLSVPPPEGGKHWTVPAEAQSEPLADADQASSQVDQLLDHRANPTALGRVADRRELAEQSRLSDVPQDV